MTSSSALKSSFFLELPFYFHRDYENDIEDNCPKENPSLLKRVYIVALPILSTYYFNAFRYYQTVTSCFNYGRLVSILAFDKSSTFPLWLIKMALATAAVAATAFSHPLGIVISTGHDLLINAKNILESYHVGNYQVLLENLAHVANNSIYLSMIFVSSLELVVISLSAQVLLTFYHGVKEIKNGNILEGIGHLIMTIIRVEQLRPQINKLQCKNQNYAQLHLQKIKDILGEEYLHFKEGDKREKFLILNASFDWNGAFNPENGDFIEDLKTLNKRFDVKYCNISSTDQIEKEINLASQMGKVTGLMIRAHGSQYSMSLDADPKLRSYINNRTLTNTTFKNLDPSCVVIIDSCQTGSDTEHGIAKQIADLSQRITYAPTYSLTSKDNKLKNVDTLEWTFDRLSHTHVFDPKNEKKQ
jgi:hypothetical protein